MQLLHKMFMKLNVDKYEIGLLIRPGAKKRASSLLTPYRKLTPVCLAKCGRVGLCISWARYTCSPDLSYEWSDSMQVSYGLGHFDSDTC